tara:strand:+ start:6195 stop:7106 length:912 start_codon:yes stop_codon:yes gene_type:complete
VEYAVEVKKLFKKYKSSDSIALDNISISIPRGSIFGLLGPNGAGKSTFINILAGLTLKNSGIVKVCDVDIDKNPKTLRGSIGVVPQEVNMDPFFTPIQILNLQAGFYGLKKKEMKNFEILKQLNLHDKANAYSRSLSGGMKRRLMVAKALVHNPQVLVLDEPTAGVDLELRKKLWEYIKKLNSNGITIILTTHYLQEAESLCDNIAIINHGRVVACEKKENLLNMIDMKEIHIRLGKKIKKAPQSLKKYVYSLHDLKIILRYSKKKINTGEILKKISESRLDIIELTTKDSDLEDIFIKILKS